jgi:hypothetical protein
VHALLLSCLGEVKAAHEHGSRATLSVDKEGVSTLMRKEASAASRGKPEADKSDPDMSDIAFYVVDSNGRNKDNIMALQRVIGDEAPWMMNRVCRVVAPSPKTWESHPPAETIITKQAWEKLRSSRNAPHGTLIQDKEPATAQSSDNDDDDDEDTDSSGGNNVACMVGHGLTWEQTTRTGASLAVVMEDSISKIRPHTKDFLLNLLKDETLRQGWDMMLLSPCMRKDEQNRSKAKGPDPHYFQACWEQFLTQFGTILEVDPEPHTDEAEPQADCSAMYVINTKSASGLLHSTFPIGKDPAETGHLNIQKFPDWGKLQDVSGTPQIVLAEKEVTGIQDNSFNHQDTNQFEIPDCAALNPESMLMPELLKATAM